MDLFELILGSNPHHENPNLELGLQASSPKYDLDPPLSDLNHADGLEDELENLDLREAEDKDSNKQEESDSDDNNESKSEVQNDKDSGNQMRKRYPYPVRPEAEDCAYYIKTGTCKFGYNCKFNHPVRWKNQFKEREEPIERPVQNLGQSKIECKYYLRAGGCKFGKACRYNHTKAKSSVTPILEFNFLGLPIRLGEKECPYYMRNGSCKYGANCRFNHPDPTAVGVFDPPSGYANGGTVSSNAASEASVGSWSSPRALNESSSFVPMMFSPNQGVPSQNSEWNGYQAPLYPPERNVHSAPTYVMNNPVLEANVYTIHQPQMAVEEYPERPGQPECSYFLKTGDCKYKSNCKYHHPKNCISRSPLCALNDKGLPLRPDQNICSYYSRYGICKFGPACKFDHPIHPAATSTEGELNSPASFGNSGSRQESGVGGTGGDNKIQQPV